MFTNRDASPVPDILTNYVFDRVCGNEPVPWLERHRERRRKALAQVEVDRQARPALRRPNTRPSHEPADYAGDYDHPGYGRMSITHSGSELRWSYRGMSETLAHRHYDTFELPEAAGRLLPARLAISFFTDREGNVATLLAPLEPLVKDVVFTRVPSGDCMDPAFRRDCVGTFSHAMTTIVVGRDNDDQLTLTVGGQPTSKLLPYQAPDLQHRRRRGLPRGIPPRSRGDGGRIDLLSAERDVHGAQSMIPKKWRPVFGKDHAPTKANLTAS